MPTAARQNEGIPELIHAISEVASGQVSCKPHRIESPESEPLTQAIEKLADEVGCASPAIDNARWVAMRLLEGDPRIVEAVRSGELGDLNQATSTPVGQQQLVETVQ